MSTDDAGRGPERLEAFSDGIFAISITLLVLDIKVPTGEQLASPTALLDALAALWPAYLGYLISFISVGNAWANHHNLLRHVHHVDHGLLFANLFLMVGVGFIPFPTALLAETLGHPGEQIGVVVYATTFTVLAVTFNVLWYRVKRVLRPETSPAIVEALNRSYRLGPPASLAAVLLAFANPLLGMAVLVGLTVLYILPRSTAA